MFFTEGVLEATALGIHAAFQIKDQQWRRLDDFVVFNVPLLYSLGTAL